MTCSNPGPDGGMCLECCIRHAICDYFNRTRNGDGLMDAGEVLACLQSLSVELLAEHPQGLAVAFAYGLLAETEAERVEMREHPRAKH